MACKIKAIVNDMGNAFSHRIRGCRGEFMSYFNLISKDREVKKILLKIICFV